MDQRQIEIFRTVIDQGSVTAAARVLAVSQPAVSGSLAKLEKRLGFDLFRREGRRLVATPEARLLHLEASHLLDGFERLGRAADEIAAGQRGTLTVATSPAPAICWLPAVAAAFRRERPQVRLRFLTRLPACRRSILVWPKRRSRTANWYCAAMSFRASWCCRVRIVWQTAPN
jgi:DNA-binding transcriptional LysR family regulator